MKKTNSEENNSRRIDIFRNILDVADSSLGLSQ